MVARAARDSVTEARAAASLATARSTAAFALSSSVAEGTLPPERRATSSKRASVACASLVVATACASCAWAEARPARDCVTWSTSLAVSSSTSTWPVLMRSFTSTCTRLTVPESSLPMLTERVGCNVPLAATVSVMSPFFRGSVT
ncbi:hypothetical protein FQZ97_855510 [compost metagenome]